MEVKLKLHFAKRQDLTRMYDLMLELECPMKSAQCKKCHYYESCLKLRDIANTLGDVIINED